jgi:hypothetical protein
VVGQMRHAQRATVLKREHFRGFARFRRGGPVEFAENCLSRALSGGPVRE